MVNVPGAEPVVLYGYDSSGNLVPLKLNADGTLSGSAGLSLGSTPSTQAIGDSASGGSDTTASKNDHKHGMPAFGSPVAWAYVLGDGAAATIARSNHVHTPGFTTASADLANDVTMSSINTFFDGPSVSLAAGTWLVIAHLSIHGLSGASIQCTGKLWDGTTSYANAQITTPNGIGSIPLAAFITLGSTTTIKASAAVTSGTTNIIRSAPANNDTTKVCSWIRAIRIA